MRQQWSLAPVWLRVLSVLGIPWAITLVVLGVPLLFEQGPGLPLIVLGLAGLAPGALVAAGWSGDHGGTPPDA